MKLHPYYHVQETDGGQKHVAFFSLKLDPIGVCPKDARNDKTYISQLLNRQVDFIGTLPSLGESGAVELRYVCRPDSHAHHNGQVGVFLRVRVWGKDKAAALHAVAAAYQSLWPNLVSISDTYHWIPLTSAAAYEQAFSSDSGKHIAELVRREAVIQLDRLDNTVKHAMGFHRVAESDTTSRKDNPSAYLVFPFIRTYSTLERLFTVLLMQEAPLAISVSLAPSVLSQDESAFFLEQIEQCERFLQLPGPSQTVEAGKFIPPLRAQAKMVLDALQHSLFTLRDNHVLLRIQVASQEPVSPGLMDALGVTVTEHVCSTDSFSDVSFEHDSHLSGGYDWFSPLTEHERAIALQHLDDLSFAPWIPSVVDNRAQRLRYLADVRQANAAFRFPIARDSDFPGLATRLSRSVLPPTALSKTGMYIGENVHRGLTQPVHLLRDDRRRHTYVVGQTGTGKSSLLLSMIMQDIKNGEGVCVLDPHGELVDQILPRIPENRTKDVIYFNPADQSSIIGLNLLEHRSDLEKDSAVNHLTEIFAKLYDMNVAGGPIFELFFRNSALLAMSDPGSDATLLEIMKVFTDKTFREAKLDQCADPFIYEFWRKTVPGLTGDWSNSNMSAYVISKLSRFLFNSLVRPIIAQQKSTIDFLGVMNESKILLVDLCKGKLGDTNSAFLGMILISLLQRAAFARTGHSEQKLKDFYLYVDEFQNLAIDSFVAILSEARKYRLNLILTNQYLHQVPKEIQDAVFGNVGTLLGFRLGMKDAEILEKEFGPVVTQSDLTNLPNYHAYLATLISGEATKPFNIQTRLDPTPENPEIAERIKRESALAYGKSREQIESEVTKRWKTETVD